MKKFYFLFAAMCCLMMVFVQEAQAYSFKVNIHGIYYQADDKGDVHVVPHTDGEDNYNYLSGYVSIYGSIKDVGKVKKNRQLCVR